MTNSELELRIEKLENEKEKLYAVVSLLEAKFSNIDLIKQLQLLTASSDSATFVFNESHKSLACKVDTIVCQLERDDKNLRRMVSVIAHNCLTIKAVSIGCIITNLILIILFGLILTN